MASFVEMLESRRLLSASLATLQADEVVVNQNIALVRADVTTAQATAKTDVKLLTADLKAGGKQNRTLAKTVKTDFTKDLARLKKDMVVALRIGKRDIKRIDSALVALQKNPSNAHSQAKYSKAILSLETDAQGSRLIVDALSYTQTANTDLSAVAAALSSSTIGTADEQKAQTDQNNIGDTLNTDAGALQTSVTTYITDASA